MRKLTNNEAGAGVGSGRCTLSVLPSGQLQDPLDF